jgi:cytoskeletal protein CcmA (bactofilin family)
MSSMPALKLQMPEQRASAVIGEGVTIKGQIFSREDLTIDGEVDGSVELQEHRLIIGEKGKIRADVSALEIHLRTSCSRLRFVLLESRKGDAAGRE